MASFFALFWSIQYLWSCRKAWYVIIVQLNYIACWKEFWRWNASISCIKIKIKEFYVRLTCLTRHKDPKLQNIRNLKIQKFTRSNIPPISITSLKERRTKQSKANIFQTSLRTRRNIVINLTRKRKKRKAEKAHKNKFINADRFKKYEEVIWQGERNKNGFIEHIGLKEFIVWWA